MDPKLETRMDNLERMVMDNNRILKKLYRAHVWRQIWSVVRFILFILVSFGIYYYVDNYIEQIKNLYLHTTENTFQQIKDLNQYINTGKSFLDNVTNVLK